jgi:predicted Zn-dependent protease with MMP-like domain
MHTMSHEAFSLLVKESVAELPKEFKKLLKNIAVIVEDEPGPEERERFGPSGGRLLGLYHGVPYKHRGPYYGNHPPDVIVIYKNSIESVCDTEEEVRRQVRATVIHEIGHYFGFSDRELREIERGNEPDLTRELPALRRGPRRRMPRIPDKET